MLNGSFNLNHQFFFFFLPKNNSQILDKIAAFWPKLTKTYQFSLTKTHFLPKKNSRIFFFPFLAKITLPKILSSLFENILSIFNWQKQKSWMLTTRFLYPILFASSPLNLNTHGDIFDAQFFLLGLTFAHTPSGN